MEYCDLVSDVEHAEQKITYYYIFLLGPESLIHAGNVEVITRVVLDVTKFPTAEKSPTNAEIVNYQMIRLLMKVSLRAQFIVLWNNKSNFTHQFQ